MTAQAIPAQLPDDDDLDEAVNRVEANLAAMEMAELALEDPLRGITLLHGAAMVMGYLAAHDPDPEAALKVLLDECAANARLCVVQVMDANRGDPGIN